MKEENKLPITPKWLDELQQKSWEPEILLSGIVLYGMFKVPDALDSMLNFFKLNIFGNSQDIDNLVALFKMGIYWLISGLILHLICRGIWIGMVGLSYTFSDGIKKSNLNYKGKFNEKVDHIPAFELIVIRLEKICSSLFSISFMLFMSLIGGYLYFFVLIVFPFTLCFVLFDLDFNSYYFKAFEFYVFTVVGVGMLGLLDFISLGYFRRFKWVARLYWPVHRFISALTLSRFYRPIYYGVVTNFNKWAFFVFLLVFTFVSISGAGSITDNTYPGDSFSRLTLWGQNQEFSAYSGYYDDQNQDNPSVRAHIPSDIINGDVLKLFVVANIVYEENMLENLSLDSLRESHPDTSMHALNMMVIDSFFTVTIDKKVVNIPRWYYHYKVTTSQRGYVAYLDISHLSEGQHLVEVKGPASQYRHNFATIPFYRDVTLQQSLPGKMNRKEEDPSVDFQPKPFGIRD